MNPKQVNDNFAGFEYSGKELKFFSQEGDIFYILLRSGNTVTFEASGKTGEEFRGWLLQHHIKDTQLPNSFLLWLI